VKVISDEFYKKKIVKISSNLYHNLLYTEDNSIFIVLNFKLLNKKQYILGGLIIKVKKYFYL
jgi:hypothetical protein